ncbi:hypothetical protein [Pedococcus soli]
MAPKIKVEIAQMDLIGQVLDRQQGHMQGVGSFVRTNCSANGAFTGVLGLLEGHYRGAYDAGSQGMTNGATIARVASDKTAATRADFIARDRAAYERIAAKQGVDAPYEAPRGGTVRPGAPIGPGGRGGSGPFGFLDQLSFLKGGKDVVSTTDTLTKPLRQNPKDLWRVHERADDLADRTDPKYWVQRGLTKQVNALRQKLDGMSPTERGTYLRNRQRDAYAGGQDWARDHVPGRQDEDGSRSPAAGALSNPDSELVGKGAKALQAPGAVLSETQGVLDAGHRLADTLGQTGRTDDAVDGPANTEAIRWATKDKGGTW